MKTYESTARKNLEAIIVRNLQDDMRVIPKILHQYVSPFLFQQIILRIFTGLKLIKDYNIFFRFISSGVSYRRANNFKAKLRNVRG